MSSLSEGSSSRNSFASIKAGSTTFSWYQFSYGTISRGTCRYCQVSRCICIKVLVWYHPFALQDSFVTSGCSVPRNPTRQHGEPRWGRELGTVWYKIPENLIPDYPESRHSIHKHTHLQINDSLSSSGNHFPLIDHRTMAVDKVIPHFGVSNSQEHRCIEIVYPKPNPATAKRVRRNSEQVPREIN